jgi:tetratricopeptide (TPR) repeat protein
MAKKQQQARPTTVPKAAQRQPVQNTAQPQQNKEPKQPLSLIKKLCIVLAVISCLVYYNTVHNGYVLDDIMVIKENKMVKQGIKAIPELLSTPHLAGYMNLPTDGYRPLSLVMFAAEYEFFDLNPTVGHFMNMLLLAACVLALFVFLDKLFEGKRTAVAFIASLLFAVHPIHVEVVANIKSRDELLCFFFAFLSLNLFINYARQGKIHQLILGALCLYLSYISKETTITFIGIIPLVFFFYQKENKQRAIFITVSMVVVTLAFLGIREAILNEAHANAPYKVIFLDNFLAGAPSAAHKFATAVLLLGYYFKLLIIPHPLVCDWSFHSVPFVGPGNILFLLAGVLHLGLFGTAIYRLVKFKKDPWAFGILFYLVTISLFSNIPFLVGAALADRFAFFASVGTCLLMALVVEKIFKLENADPKELLRWHKAYIAVLPIVVVYMALTISRNSDWKDNYTLYKTDVEKSPNNTRLYYYMGAELQKKYDEAKDPATQNQIIADGLGYLRHSLEIYPDNPDSHAELGATYFRGKNYDSAVKHLARALELKPKNVNASTNMGTVYMTQQRYAEAIPYYRWTVSINPGHVLALFNLGVCHYHTGKSDSAVYYFKKTIAIEPEYLNHMATQYTSMIYKYMGQMDSSRKYEMMAKQFNPAFKP